MANIAIFRINYKSDFILTLNSDAGWLTPFCIKFWTDAPSQAYFVGFDGTTYTHCAPVAGEPTKLLVQFDDHHLPIGDLKFQIGYHFTVADFPTSVEDEVINQASVIIEVDGAPAKVMLDFNGETAPEIEFSLPAYANEAQRIENEQQRIENEQQRIDNEQQRIDNEQTRQRNEGTRIENEQQRVQEFGQMKGYLEQATRDAAAAAENANEKAVYAKNQGDYAKQQGDYAKQQGDTAKADHERAEDDHRIAGEDHTQAGSDHTRAGEDHTQAGSDHTRAGEDHTRAGEDHTRAGEDHTRAESDHAAVEVYIDSLGAFDISAYHATGGVLAKYADLTAALGTNGANVPDALRKGGMSVKFVQSSDNKYVQYFLTKDEWSVSVDDWEKVNLEEEVEHINNEIIVGNAIVMPLISTRDLRPMSDGYVHTNGEYSYIVKVKEGDELTIDFTIVSGTYIRLGFTSVYPANGVAVTSYGDSGPQFHKIEKTAPFDGYLLMECASDFVELSVSKDNSGTIGRYVYENNKEISNLKDIVDKQEIITTDTRSAHYIKYSDSTLYEGGNFSVTEPIEVKKGDRIIVTEEAVNNSIAVISTCDSSLSNISAKVPSNAEHLHELYTYEYFVEQDGYVSITFYTSYGTTIKIVNNINDKINIIQEEVDALANQFADKNFGVDGDSITAGNQWSKIVADNLHLNNHHNVGVGGATWACNVVTYDGVDYTPQEYDDPNFAGIGTEAITDPTTAQQAANNCAKVHVQKFIAEVTAGTYPTPDIFCFAFGTNDIKPTKEQVDAAIAATDYPTGDALFNMAGGMRWCLQKIRETYPSCTIFIMLPIQRSWQKYTSWDKAQLLAKVSYIREIAQDFGVQVIDMYHNCGINGCLEKGAPNYGPYLRDGLHPNDDGRKNMGNYVTAIIKAFYFQQY